MNTYVQTGGCDGFILVPHLTPTGLDAVADHVVPILQEWGVFRADYDRARADAICDPDARSRAVPSP